MALSIDELEEKIESLYIKIDQYFNNNCKLRKENEELKLEVEELKKRIHDQSNPSKPAFSNLMEDVYSKLDLG